MISYSNQIANILAQYLPYQYPDFGYWYSPTSVEIEDNKVILTFTEEEFTILESIITVEQQNTFTTKDFYTKNYITEISASPEGSPFFLKIKTSKPHNYKKGQTVTLKGFTDVYLNTSYSFIKNEGAYVAILYPNTPVDLDNLPTEDFGYISSQYKASLNGIHTLEVEDNVNFKLSFTIDLDNFYSVDSVDDLDLTILPKLYDYHANLKVIDLVTYLANFTDPENMEYLIIDTASLSAIPLKSTNNKSDANYSVYSKSAYIERGYTIDLYYLLERSTDDIDNQTKSGSDIDKKQITLEKVIDSILREPLIDENRLMSSITLSEHSVDRKILEGSVAIRYVLEFSVITLQNSILEKEAQDSVRIKQINNGTDEIILDNY